MKTCWMMKMVGVALFGVLVSTVWADTPTVRIMPLGDSITHGTPVAGGYRLPLYRKLTQAGFHVDYVGTQTTNPANDLPDPDHEGHGGWTVIGQNGIFEHLPLWLSTIPTPDVVLIHIGTNDSGADDFYNRVEHLGEIVNLIATRCPYAQIVVSTLLERTDNATRNEKILTQFNPLVEPLVQSLQQAGRRVHFLDMCALLDKSTDLADGLHPNEQGYEKMAAGWFNVITSITSPNGDSLAPALIDAKSVDDLERIQVAFSKPLNGTTLPGPVLWKLSDPAVTVQSLTLSEDLRTVTLTVSPALTAGTEYTLTVEGTVSDLTNPPHTVANPTATFTPFVGGYETNVPESEWGAYKKIYIADIPERLRLGSRDVHTFYTLDASDACPPYDRVAYYLELRTKKGEAQYAWVSMDAFTDDPTKIGIPTFKSGAVWKEFVSNMNVYCNVDGVVTGTGLSGNIEFWPWNYHHTAKLNIGAELLAYDFDDEISTGGNYGSMQVHNYLAKQTIFAFNRFNDGAAPCLGIGNCETSDPEHLGYDWTFAENASDYTYRRLIVLVRPVADTTPPTVLAAKIGSAGTQLFVTFSEKIAKDTLSLSTFTSAGFTVEEYTFSEDGKTVNLKITPADPAGGAVLSVAGARDLFGNVMDPAEITIEPYGIPDAVAANVGDALAGYEMVYAAEMGELGNFNNDPRAYWLDQSMATGKIDRVAYYFELEDYLGAKNYVFTSFDTPTQSRRLLGVPTAEKAIYFQQPVFNAFVKSSMGDLNLGSLPDGCNIEFWAGNYHNENEAGIPNATDDHYDFGDRMTYFPNQPGHGSMQVHCFTQSKTLWSLTNFGEDGHVLGVGWNNSNMNNHQDSWDWTFAENARNFLHRRLYIFVRPATDEEDPGKPEMAALAASLTAEIQAKIGEELTEGYRLIAASTNIPTMCYIRDAAWAAENFYAVDYRGTVPPSSFDRVAYFIQYQDTDDAEPKYIWTSMDTFAPSVQQLCVPTGGYYFQKSVSNLDVASNAGNITSGTGIETGCIEFWASNYGVRNSVAEWGGSDSAFDWNDSEMNTGIGHGSMQVHNYGAGEVLWAFNNFNKNNASDAPCFGIGNNPYGSDLDWTFTTRVAQYRNMRLCILVRETASQEKLDETIKAEIAERVGDSVLAGFETLFAITNVPPQCQMNQPYWAPNLLAIDNRFKYGDGSFSRVAYFMEVQFSHEESPRYVLVVMDPFTDKGYQFGIPIGGYAFQKRVEHMDVYTNDPHITPGRDIATGCIEFWASNYGNGNSANGWGGSGGIFDWDDTGWSDARGGHGSMQIHNYGAREILICFNHFNGNNMPGLGVGQNQNVTNADLDYTFTYNSDQYQRIRFVCMILPAPETFPDKRPTPAVKRVISARSGDLLAVRFDQPLSQSVLDTVSFDLDGDIEVKGISRYDDQTLIVSVSPMTPGEAYTLYYENAIGIGGGAADGSFDFRALSTAEATAPTCLRGVDEVADYRLIYRLALPDVRRDIYADTPYLVDEEYFFAGQYDRIGYCMELTTANNVAKWVWVSMDAFTPNIANIAVPTYDRGMMFQQVVGNMNVFASPNAGVMTGVGIQTGNIEFWPSNYNEGGVLGLGGNNDAFDFDDGNASVAFGHGSMQVHNYGAQQTLFAINSFGSNSGDELCLGIGNDVEHPTYPDWTHNHNATTFTVRNLYVFVREKRDESTGNGPTIFREPEDVKCQHHDTVTLSVLAGGATAYQWYCDGVAIPGAVGATLTLKNARPDQSGAYTVFVSSAKGATLSAPAQVTISPFGTVMIIK